MRHVILFNGGIGSTVLLAKMIEEYGRDNILAVWVNYGQRTAERERESIVALREYYDVVTEIVVIMPPIERFVPGVLMAIGIDRAMPDGKVYVGCYGDGKAYSDVAREVFRTTVETPLSGMSAVDVVRLGQQLNVPFELTYSCEKGWDVHCGRCSSCLRRKEAFERAQIEDVVEFDV